MTTKAAARTRLAQLAARHGLQLVAVTDASPLSEDRVRMEDSVAAGRMARMEWMGGQRPATATDPGAHDPEARSVLVVAAPYDGGRDAWDPNPDALRRALAPVLAGRPSQPAGRVARYALGTDYHTALRARLEALAADLRASGLPAGEVAYVDDRPLAERALAARGGIGWIGKNTNLLTHQKAGSWVFLGALLTSAELPADEPLRTTCGSCTRCLSGCPTGALIGPQTIDARRCISYLTIEHAGVLDAWEATAIGNWIFGCDVCQEVCPVNAEADDPGPLNVPLLPLIEWLLPLGTRAFGRAVGETALTRAGRHRLLRNAIAALANAGPMSPDARALLRLAARDRREEVRRQAQMALGEVGV
ncbi:MAG TPA: tRNA epoxyqueuosine(34) reductase QueG [Candidatus Limnocylindria bacterium]|nr:tRNA epoxyqueuosine(34) reductase QueG [Candidatus Limnocylindria bacterium]